MTMTRVILVLVDGLRAATAEDCFGFTRSWVAARGGVCGSMECELPSLSRPLYATLLTGLPPAAHGIVSNAIGRRLDRPHLFGLARAAGLRTAAAAYHWFAALANGAPSGAACREVEDEAAPIQHGRFYWQDQYPDDHLFADAEALRLRHDPHLLLIHPMGVDHAGHVHGGDGPEYSNAARRIDDLLAQHLPGWVEAGAIVLITSDHGMGTDRSHGGWTEQERRVPFYAIGSDLDGTAPFRLRQVEIAGLCADLLGLAHALPRARRDAPSPPPGKGAGA